MTIGALDIRRPCAAFAYGINLAGALVSGGQRARSWSSLPTR